MTDIQIKSIHFPSLDPTTANEMDQLARAFVPQTISISMRRLVACVPKPATTPTVELNNTPHGSADRFAQYNPYTGTQLGEGLVCRDFADYYRQLDCAAWQQVCNDQYCSRYIVGTRGKGEVSTGTNHLGFRCVMTRDEWKMDREKGAKL